MLIYGKPVRNWKCVYKDCKALCCDSGREVTIGDTKRISEKLHIPPEDFVELKDNKGLFRLKGKRGRCIFLNDDYSCQLYGKDIEPILCHMFPFDLDSVVYADEIILKIKQVEDCPGFGKGDNVSAEFEQNIERLGNQFIREIKDYLRYKGEGLSPEEIIRRI